VTKQEVADAELLLAEDSVTLVGARADYEHARNDLLDNLGIPMATRVVLVDKEITFQPIELKQDDWIATALRNRPELFESQEELAQSHLNMTAAKNLRFPQLDFIGSYQRSQIGSTYRRSIGLDGEVWSAGLLFSVPLGNVAGKSVFTRAKREYQRIQLELEQRKRQVELEVRSRVIELQQRLEEIPLLRLQVQQAQNLLNISRAQFSLGETSNLDITETYGDLLTAETELLEAIVAYNIALAELEASIAQPI
jgi:outer membrane protein TolC